MGHWLSESVFVTDSLLATVLIAFPYLPNTVEISFTVGCDNPDLSHHFVKHAKWSTSVDMDGSYRGKDASVAFPTPLLSR